MTDLLGTFRDSLPASNLFELDQPYSGIELDKRHIAIRLETTWIIYRRRPDAWLEKIDQWTGNRRSIFARLEQHGIEPSHAAEAKLNQLTEGRGFREDDAND